MAHKVHPKAFRIKGLQSWDSRYLNLKKFPEYLEEDFKLRNIIEKNLGKTNLDRIEVERFPRKVRIIISTSRPGLVIGREGERIAVLKSLIQKVMGKKELTLDVKEVKNPWVSATLTANWVAQQIEKRMPFRKVLKQAIQKVMATKGIEGVRVEVGGRLNGTEIARKEWLGQGRLPRQTIRANIDYAKSTAFCTYGAVGVKVWIYKGEQTEE